MSWGDVLKIALLMLLGTMCISILLSQIVTIIAPTLREFRRHERVRRNDQ